MALNPPISLTGLPLRVDGEYLLLERKDIEVEFKIPQWGKKTSKGKLYLTSARMVFVSSKFDSAEFKAFDIPLKYLLNFDFKQPIFGSNYLQGTVRPLYDMLPGNTTFKLWFMSGGCSNFLRVFFSLIEHIQSQQRSNQQNAVSNQFIQNIQNNWQRDQAFVDPNDPTTMFLQQPQENYNNAQQQGNYVGVNYDYPAFDEQNNQNNIQMNQQQMNMNMNQQQQQQGVPIGTNINQPVMQQMNQPNMQQMNQPGMQQMNQPNNQQMNQPNNQQMQPMNIQQPQQQQQMNVGYYFGFWGPQLNRNQQ